MKCKINPENGESLWLQCLSHPNCMALIAKVNMKPSTLVLAAKYTNRKYKNMIEEKNEVNKRKK